MVLCGSLREDSVTHRALEIVALGVRKAGGSVTWADPWVRQLPLFSEAAEDVAEGTAFREAAAEARGFVWGSPEYHAAPAGVLKNALDYLSFDQTENKWVGLVASAGGEGAGASTLAMLRTIARGLHLWCPPDQVAVPGSRKALNEDGSFKDREVEERLIRLGEVLVRSIQTFCARRRKDSV